MSEKVLIVSPVSTHPNDEGNKRRVFDVVASLQDMGYETFFLYVPLSGFDGLHSDEGLEVFHHGRAKFAQAQEFESSLREKLARKLIYCLGKAQLLRLFPQLRSAIRSLFENQDYYCPAGLSEWVRDFCRREKPVACIVEYFHFTKVLEELPDGVRGIVDTHDIFTNRNQSLRPVLGKYFRWYSLTAKQEKNALCRADSVIAIQNKEAQFFRELLGKDQDIRTVGLLAEPDIKHRSSERVCFGYLGSRNPLNVDGLQWFLDNCWGRILEQIPDAELEIAGSVCSKISDGPYTKLGIVPEISDFFERIDCLVNPMFLGTGLKIKAVESLRHGIPIISTPLGIEGLEASVPDAVSIVKDADEMVKACLGLLGDSRRVMEMAQNAKTFYRQELERSRLELRKSIISRS